MKMLNSCIFRWIPASALWLPSTVPILMHCISAEQILPDCIRIRERPCPTKESSRSRLWRKGTISWMHSAMPSPPRSTSTWMWREEFSVCCSEERERMMRLATRPKSDLRSVLNLSHDFLAKFFLNCVSIISLNISNISILDQHSPVRWPRYIQVSAASVRFPSDA